MQIEDARVLHGNKTTNSTSVRTVLFDILSHCDHEACHNFSESVVVRSRVQRYICETKNEFVIAQVNWYEQIYFYLVGHVIQTGEVPGQAQAQAQAHAVVPAIQIYR